jgi:hypothetical protein
MPYFLACGAFFVLIVVLAIWLVIRLSDGGKEGPE